MPDTFTDLIAPAGAAPDVDPDATEIEPAPDPSRRQLRDKVRDRASDVLRVTRHPLDAFFSPSSVAVIGATEKEGSVGRTIFWNLISSPFGGHGLPDQPQAARASSASRPTRALVECPT